MRPPGASTRAIAPLVAACLVACTAAESSPNASQVASAEPSAAATGASAPASAAASVAPPSATVTPAAVPATPIQLAWTAAQPFPDIVEGLMGDGDGGRFIVVGGGDAPPQQAWTSTDGTTWSAQAVPIASLDDLDADLADLGPDFASKAAGMGTLVRLDETVYSIGIFSFNDFFRPVGWRWTDGGAWQAITSSSPFYEHGRVEDLIGADGGLVATRLEPGITFTNATSTVWTWRPATSWTQSDFGTIDDEPLVATDLAWADSTFLATGHVSAETESDTITLAAWTSPDGDAWTRIDPPSGGTELCDVQPHPAGGFVALGVEANQTVAWTWNPQSGWSGGAALPGGPGHGSPGSIPFADLCQLLHVGGQLVAVTTVGGTTRFWSSTDGAAWVQASAPAANGALAAAVGDRVVLVMIDYLATGGATYAVQTATVAP